MATEFPPADGSAPKTQRFAGQPPMGIDLSKRYSAEMVTTKGTMVFALDALAAPRTVNNFVFLARYHYFDGHLLPPCDPGLRDPGRRSGGDGCRRARATASRTSCRRRASTRSARSPWRTPARTRTAASSSSSPVPTGSASRRSTRYFGQLVTGRDVLAAIDASARGSGTPQEHVVIDSVTITEAD